MRTTITMDDDVASAVERLRHEKGIGLSEAVNELVRRGLRAAEAERATFTQTTSDLGSARLGLDDIGGLLDALEGPDHR